MGLLSHYQGVRKAHDVVRKKTASISFADDKYFPALQAAEWSQLVRCSQA